MGIITAMVIRGRLAGAYAKVPQAKLKDRILVQAPESYKTLDTFAPRGLPLWRSFVTQKCPRFVHEKLSSWLVDSLHLQNEILFIANY